MKFVSTRSQQPTLRVSSRKNVRPKKISPYNQYVSLQTMIEAVHNPVVILDKALKIQTCNKAFTKVFGHSKKTISGTDLSIHSKRNPIVHDIEHRVKNMINDLSSFVEFEATYHFSTVGPRRILINAKPIHSQPADEVLIFMEVEDITQKKLIEQQKDDFVGYVTHELKTPLASLSAFIQILQGYFKKTKDKKSQFLLNKAYSQVERLTNLLSSFHHVYKAQNGMLELKTSKFNLADLVHEVIETFQYTTSTHMISMEGTTTGLITADRERIHQVLSNLLMNAIKYSPKADKIIIKIEQSAKEVKVQIQDFGIGIPKSQQQSVFERFFRVRAKEKYNIKGLGLGLYITREIISAHEGKLWVESSEGKGATFSFSLPLKK